MRRRTLLRLFLAGLVFVGGGSVGFAGEQLNLTTPEIFPAPASITYWKIDGWDISRSKARVVISLIGTNGEERTFTITGADATAYMNALNKRNATTISNEKWTFEQLKSRGYLAGTVSGTPD